MENGRREWKLRPNASLSSTNQISIRGLLEVVKSNLAGGDERPTITLGQGDPSHFPSFRTVSTAEEAIVTAVQSGKYNCYSPPVGFPTARRAIAEYLSKDLPYKLLEEDVYVTSGCQQAIEVAMSVLAHPNANILLPRPCFPNYNSCAAYLGMEVRHVDLLPERNWEMDLEAVEDLVDDNTVAIAIINPGNPCGNVYTYEYLAKVAEMARRLGVPVIADEVYGHLTYGSTPFVPMGVFGSVVPILTLGSISKRWAVPGWRLGWLVTTDPNGVLKQTGIVTCINNLLHMLSEPATFIQAAVPDILGRTKEDFFNKIINKLKETSDICYNQIKDIDCLTCFSKPEGSMFALVQIDLPLLQDIKDDIDFCCKLAKEESMIILPGCAVGLKNWLRITFSVEPSTLEDGMARLKSFCQRHMKKQ